MTVTTMRSGPDLLRQWIKNRAFKTQREAAEELGWSGEAGQVTLSQYLTGKRRPNRDNALTMLDRAGIPIASWSLSQVSELPERSVVVPLKRKR